MFDAAIGRYYRGRSIIHLLDPRVKLLSLLLYIASLFYFSSLSSLMLSFVVILIVIVLTHIPLKYVIKGTFRIFILSLFFALLMILFEENGVRKALTLVYRLTATGTASSLFSLTTRPVDAAKGIEKALGKGKLRMPVHILATVIMIAFRFIPIFLDEAERVMDAQKSRGCSFEEKGLVKKAGAFLPLLVPLFVSAFRRADELALSMDARGYNIKSATSLYPLKYKTCDILSFFLLLLYCALMYLVEVNVWI